MGNVRDRVANWIEHFSWADLVVGAIIGVIIGLLATPLVGPPITNLYESLGVHDGPEVETTIEKTGEYYPPGEPVEEFGGLIWNESYEVYRIDISNSNERPVDRLKLRWQAPGCIVHTNTEGEMIYGQYWLHDRYSLEVSSESQLAIN